MEKGFPCVFWWWVYIWLNTINTALADVSQTNNNRKKETRGERERKREAWYTEQAIHPADM